MLLDFTSVPTVCAVSIKVDTVEDDVEADMIEAVMLGDEYASIRLDLCKDVPN